MNLNVAMHAFQRIFARVAAINHEHLLADKQEM